MIVPMKVPEVGESIQEVEIARWLKQEGDVVQRDEDIVEVESEKATLSIPTPAAGRIVKILKRDGDTAEVGEVIAEIDHEARPEQNEVAGQQAVSPDKPTDQKSEVAALNSPQRAADPVETLAKVKAQAADEPVIRARSPITSVPGERQDEKLEPASRTAAAMREETIVPMSMIRRRIAARLVEAQQSSALLTTFNEIDMSAVIALRAELRQPFQEQYGVKLGFMSFFVKAAIEALERFPEVNAEVRGTDVVFHNYHDVGIAIGGGKGLVVPVLRNADQLSFAEIESAIDDFANRAVNHKLRLEELTGGTFTISNGGVYGSLLSTPIINPPQSGVLGLHAIQDRPVARAGDVVIRPMMYVALTYDHRIVDGREAVGFLHRIKDLVEQPARILLEV